MECKDVSEKLSLFVLGDLTAADAETVDAHLEACAACQAEADRQRRTLAALRSSPGLDRSSERRKAVFAAASREGLFAARPLWLRLGVPLGAIATAAAVAFILPIVLPWWTAPQVDPGETNRTPPTVVESPVVSPIAEFVEGTGVVLFRDGNATPIVPKRHDPVFRKDRLLVQGARNSARLRFFQDALEVVLWGFDPQEGRMREVQGGTGIRLEGVSDKAYRLHLDGGLLTGAFTQPIQDQPSRQRGDRFIPLAITSPVGMAEIMEGRVFRVRQQKVDLAPGYFEFNPRRQTFKMRLENYDIETFLSRHLNRKLDHPIDWNPNLLSGKTVTLLCNSVPSDAFPEILDRTLATVGLTFRLDGDRYRVTAREGGTAPPAPGWENPAFGAFEVDIISDEGRIKVSGRNPNRPGAIFLTAGQSGVIRPGQNPKSPLTSPGAEVKGLENMELVGTLVGKGPDRMGLIRAGGGVRKVRRGDDLAGYRVEWVGWDHLVLDREGRETRLYKKH